MAVAVCIRFSIQNILNNDDSIPHGHDSWLRCHWVEHLAFLSVLTSDTTLKTSLIQSLKSVVILNGAELLYR